jgi:hypothetical protein
VTSAPASSAPELINALLLPDVEQSAAALAERANRWDARGHAKNPAGAGSPDHAETLRSAE